MQLLCLIWGSSGEDTKHHAAHVLADVRSGYYQSKAVDNCFQLLSRQTLEEEEEEKRGKKTRLHRLLQCETIPPLLTSKNGAFREGKKSKPFRFGITIIKRLTGAIFLVEN